LKTLMVLPLYSNSIKFIQFAIIIRIFPSIDNDFSFYAQMFLCKLYIFLHFDAFMPHICIQNYTYGIFKVSLLLHI
jgi:hypothetical protein